MSSNIKSSVPARCLPSASNSVNVEASVKKGFKFQLWAWLAFIVAAAGIALAYYILRPQYRTAQSLVRLLPRSDAVLFYADVDALRQSEFLGRLQGAKGLEDPEYRRFVHETGFSYERDLDALAVVSLPNQIFATLRGKFDWRRLSEYARRQGGTCHNTYCQVPTSTHGRWLSFFPIRSGVMGLSMSSDPSAAYQLLPRRGAPEIQTPSYPAWVTLPRRLLDDPKSLAPGAQLFATALSSATQVTLGIEQNQASAGQAGFMVRLSAKYDSPVKADDAQHHLQQITTMLKAVAARQQEGPKTPDLASVLLSGTFREVNGSVEGFWPVPQQAIDSLLK
jgi:hypothetical protein